MRRSRARLFSTCGSDILSKIGDTPLVQLCNVAPKGMRIFAKLEGANPGGSLKDRVAFAMIEKAKKSGKLKPGMTVVEGTSGSTGISLAWICAVKGYKLILTFPKIHLKEKRFLCELLGAEVRVVRTGATNQEAQKIISSNPEKYFMPDQFRNSANVEAHYRHTGPEIWCALKPDVDCFVAGVGTGGTVTGVGRFLKEQKRDVRIVAVEPANCRTLSGGAPGAHGIDGLGPHFVPPILDTSLIDSYEAVTDEEAIEMVFVLAREEGILAGVSSGAACIAAVREAKRLGRGATVVTVFPDSADRYMSVLRKRRGGGSRG